MALFSARKFGVVLVASGVAHLVSPDAFVGITKPVFPNDTEEWVKRNGATETALGVAMLLPKTRKLAKLGLLGYVGWLGYSANAAKANA